MKILSSRNGVPSQPALGFGRRDSYILPATDNFQNGNSTHGPLLLLIEQDLGIREVHAAHLRRAGWSVISASSCHEARSLMSGPVEVLLLDSSSGTGTELVELVRVARRTSSNPRVIFLLSATDASPAEIRR